MKKNVNRMLFAAAIIAGSLSFTPAAKASLFTGNNPVELKVVSPGNESELLELVITGTSEAEYKILIRDENYTVLYADKLKGRNLRRRFQLDREDAVGYPETVTFEVTNLGTGETVVYKVNTVTRMQKNTQITVAR